MAKNDATVVAAPPRRLADRPWVSLLCAFLVLTVWVWPTSVLSEGSSPSEPPGTEEAASVVRVPSDGIERSPAIAGSVPAPVPPDELRVPPGGFSLPALVEMALKYHPSTQRYGAALRAAQQAVGVARGAYYPAIGLSAEIDRDDGPFPLIPGDIEETYGQATASLSYLLFDFGGRRARVDATRQVMQTRDAQCHQNTQDVVLGVAESYYELIGALAGLDAAEDSLKEAETNLESAEAMLKAGLGTITDVLLARARRARQVLGVVSWRGDVAAGRGRLATAVGLPANTSLEVSVAATEDPLEINRVRVEDLIRQGLERRPDLAASKARLEETQSLVRNASSRMLPEFRANADFGWLMGEGNYQGDFSVNDIIYSAALAVSYPLFEGFAIRDAVRESKAVADEARAALRGKQDSVTLEVWDSYQRLVTAGQRIEASIELLQSAELSYTSALTAYRAGLTTITELVEAQTTLSDARFADVDARTTWHVALVRLARDTGQIPLSGEPWEPGVSNSEERSGERSGGQAPK